MATFTGIIIFTVEAETHAEAEAAMVNATTDLMAEPFTLDAAVVAADDWRLPISSDVAWFISQGLEQSVA